VAGTCAPSDRSTRGFCHAWRLAAECGLPGGRLQNKGFVMTWHLAARLVPPSSLGTFRLAALRLRQVVMLLSMASMCVVLRNDAILGSGDVMP